MSKTPSSMTMADVLRKNSRIDVARALEYAAFRDRAQEQSEDMVPKYRLEPALGAGRRSPAQDQTVLVQNVPTRKR